MVTQLSAPGFVDEMTLKEARDRLREMVEAGHRCPCCRQYAKVYRRKLNSGMARSLIKMYRLAGTDAIDVPEEVGARSREEGKLRYWGLIEELAERREDGGRAGWWRVTLQGQAFVLGRSRVPSHARIYDGRCLGLVGDPISIRDALGEKFNYEELMSSG